MNPLTLRVFLANSCYLLQIYTTEGRLRFGAGAGDEIFPASLSLLTLLNVTPLNLPACVGRLPALHRLFFSECAFEDDDFLQPLLQSTSLQVGVAWLQVSAPDFILFWSDCCYPLLTVISFCIICLHSVTLVH